ncbi:MAG: hypothetical protein ACR2LG_06740 [Actinomycetota bacterium]
MAERSRRLREAWGAGELWHEEGVTRPVKNVWLWAAEWGGG